LAWAILAAVLAFFTLLPIAGMAAAWGFFAYRTSKGYQPPQPLPEVAVVLPLRGADPSLEACLKGLLAQDYPAYRVHIVIDSAEDPAQALVAGLLAKAGPRAAIVQVETRRSLGTDCSAKLSAQRQVLTALDDEVAVIAFLDADCTPSPDWLRELVAPFSDARVGATTGFRWAAPGDAGWGTLVRYVFFGVAFPQHFLYRIPWGGSLAIRRSAVESTGLIEHWTHCLCEDTSAYGRLRSAGLRLAFVPRATQVGAEAADLDGVHTFILRQLLCVRLHHVLWPLMLVINVATIASFLVCCLLALLGIVGALLAILGVATQMWKLIAFAIIPALYFAGLLTALAVGDRMVRRAVAAPPPPPSGPRLVVAAAIAVGSSTYAMLAAPFVRSIGWRGITYDVVGRDRIHMRSYNPYHAPGTAAPRSIV
jgi:cellulose synthase/poly-beta-1,6-N-acetylglucosamine synthase-like glycosyltransferase